MRRYLQNIHIKGKTLWKVCVCFVLGVALACCGEQITSVDMPATAVVGATVPITVNINIPTVGNGGPDYLVLGILVPKGWKAAQNTTIAYTSDAVGNGTMSLIPDSSLPKNGGGLTWSAYMKKTFGNQGNLIDDMEWVAFQSDKAYTHNGTTIDGKLNVKMKMGVDGNPTIVKLAFVITDTGNGFTSDGNGTYYSMVPLANCFELTGGTGDLVDFCNPQLTIVDPPKSLDNDFVTLTFDGNVVKTPVDGESEVYLCATAHTNDGKTLIVCEQTDKTKMKQTTATSKKYQITIWPKSFFGATDAQTLTKIEYFITDKTNTKKVGYGNTLEPFTYTFKCQ